MRGDVAGGDGAGVTEDDRIVAQGGYIGPLFEIGGVERPIIELPPFTAARGGIDFSRPPVVVPGYVKRYRRFRMRWQRRRERLALFIAPSLRRDGWDDW